MMLPFFKKAAVANKILPEATLLWRDQLALKPVHDIFGLQRITELHRRLKLMRAMMTFKGSKIIT
jgi:hypothetical protein